MNTVHHALLVHSAKQIVQVTANGELFLKGKRMKNIAVLEDKVDSQTYSIVVSREGRIVDLGTDSSVNQRIKDVKFDKIIDATGKSIIPGLIDAHTHPIWAGDRVHEFALKLSGASYMEIHQSGGGIGFTVTKTRNATQDELLESLKKRLWMMIKSGTTFAEVKSGYGLDAQSEEKLLRVLDAAKRNHPIGLSITFLGAHSIPENLSSGKATELVVNEQIPMVARLIKEGVQVENIDVFCEKGVFDLHQSEEILKNGKEIGLNINFHGDELNPTNSAEMGVKLGAAAISHLEEISDSGIEEMSSSESVAVILPSTAFVLHLPLPPVRKMIENDVIVALGSDFNPNVHCLSMPVVMYLACVLFRMSMEEVLTASTINAAASIKQSRDFGSIEIGKFADILVLNCSRWEHLIYQFGNHDHVVDCVIKKGKIVHSRK